MTNALQRIATWTERPCRSKMDWLDQIRLGESVDERKSQFLIFIANQLNCFLVLNREFRIFGDSSKISRDPHHRNSRTTPSFQLHVQLWNFPFNSDMQRLSLSLSQLYLKVTLYLF